MKKRFLSLFTALALALALLPAAALAADGDTVWVGGVALTGSAEAPAYAVTDGDTGAVSTDGAGADRYNVKWDGATLTLRNAAVKGGHRFESELYEAAIYGPGDLQIALEGENAVQLPGAAEDVYEVYGVYAGGGLTLSGGGSLAVTAAVSPEEWQLSYGISARSAAIQDCTVTIGSGDDDTFYYYGLYTSFGDITVTGGAVTVRDSECGINAYEGAFTATGGTVEVASYAHSIYAFSVTIQDSTVTAVSSHSSAIYSENSVAIRDSAVTATGGSDGIFGSGSITISGDGTVVKAAGCLAGIYAGSLAISGGQVTATGQESEEHSYISKGIDVSTSLTISGGTVTAAGGAAGISRGEGDIIIAPQYGWEIDAAAGTSAQDAAAGAIPPDGVVNSAVDGRKYFHSEARRGPADVWVGGQQLTATYGGRPPTP